MAFSAFKTSYEACKDAMKVAPSVCHAENGSHTSENMNIANYTDTVFAVSVLLSAFFVIIQLGCIRLIGSLAIILVLIVLCCKSGKQNMGVRTEV